MPETNPMNSDTDISDKELQAIQDQVDAEIERHGLPTDDELLLEVENLNQLYQRERNELCIYRYQS